MWNVLSVGCPTHLQVVWILGVNHVATGLATYMNIALMDPLQKLGLQVWGMNYLGGWGRTATLSTPTHLAHTFTTHSASQAFDDSEMPGSADDLLEGGMYQNLSRFLFAVRFSRDCTGKSL